tara:strand:- start:2245 stop:2442 length:198 start_codon:yes stop_codon:yes gene_type:complete
MEKIEITLQQWEQVGTPEHAIILGVLLGMFITFGVYLCKVPIKGSKKYFAKKIYHYATTRLKQYK